MLFSFFFYNAFGTTAANKATAYKLPGKRSNPNTREVGTIFSVQCAKGGYIILHLQS